MAIEELKNKIKDYPISEIVGLYINITKKGNNYTALCPFHDDHHPSLHIDNEKGMFKCFVDNTGGDAINFVQQYKNLDFIDSLKDICNKLGLRFKDYERNKRHPKFEMAENILQKAQLIYTKIATKNTSFEYQEFIKTRKLTDQSIKDFCIGFAPKQSVISAYLQSLKDADHRIKACRMACDIQLIRSEKDHPLNFYDTFRERIMFPIWNRFGHVVGFCGRKTKEYQKGKYINSQQSFIFHKKEILYGLHLAKEAVKKKQSIILTEGHMDCIALHQYGLKNTVAVMGTALSGNALRQIKELTKSVYLCFDNDQAGHNASQKANELLLREQIIPKLINISPHKDPDEFLQQKGTIAFDERIQNAKTFIDILIDAKFPKKIPTILDHRIEALEGFFPILEPLKDSLMATERIMTLAKRLGLTSNPDGIIKSYKEYCSRKSIKPPFLSKSIAKEERKKDTFQHQHSPHPTKGEKAIIREIALNPSLLERTELEKLLDFIEESELKDSILRLKALYSTVGGVEFSKNFESIFGKEYERHLNGARTSSKQQELRIINDICLKLKKEKLMVKKAQLKEKQKSIISPQEREELLRELTNVDKELILKTKR